MGKRRKLKLDPLAVHQLKRLAKDIIDEARIDRKLAKETYDYFKNRADNDPEDDVAKKCMVDCLKLMQSSPEKVLKLVQAKLKEMGSSTENIIDQDDDGISVEEFLEEVIKKDG